MNKKNSDQPIKENIFYSNLQDSPFRFILDTGATKHIISDARYFASMRTCDIHVKWGNAKKLKVEHFGDVYMRFKGNS